MSEETECAKLLTQTEISLRAIRLHLLDYQLQLLRLSVRKPVEIVDLSKAREKK